MRRRVSGNGGAGGAPSARTGSVPSSTGAIYTISRLLGSSSALSLVAGTNANLTLAAGNQISATAAIAVGASQTAVVREAVGQIAVEYPVTLTARAAAAAPAAVGSLEHRYFTVGTGAQTFSVASGFSGSGITYSVTSAPAGAVYTINSATGQMVFQTDAPVNSTADGNVVVRATNAGGFAEQSFPLFVTAAATFTILARQPNGTVNVESLADVWDAEVAREANGTFTLSEAA